MQNIDVSVVVPTYNRVSLLKKTIKSLFEQTYPANKYEIIVCDDNSKDNTEEMIQNIIKETSHNLKYIKIESDIKGPAKVRNAGILNSSGSIIGFTDDDCVVPNNWIELAVECFKENEGICGLSGTVITPGNCKRDKFKIPHRVTVLHEDGSYVTSNIFYKKEVLLNAGCFDVEMRYLEDIELGWRVEKIGKIMFKPELLVKHNLFCLSLIDYLKKLKFIEYWVIMYSKHPEHRKKDNLILNRMKHKRTFYTIFLVLSMLFYLFDKNISHHFLIITTLVYLWSYVAIDAKIIRYPLRIMKFPAYTILGLVRFIYSIKGSVKAKYIMFY